MRDSFPPTTEEEHSTACHRCDDESNDTNKHSIVDSGFGENQRDTDSGEEKHAVVFSHGVVNGPPEA